MLETQLEIAENKEQKNSASLDVHGLRHSRYAFEQIAARLDPKDDSSDEIA
jgi:FtsZ-binding cell division protein ZapB